MTTLQQAEAERLEHLKEFNVGFAAKFPTLISHLLKMDDLLIRFSDRNASEELTRLQPVYDDR